MYAVISDGVLLALCDKPRYVKMNEASGAYVEAEEAQAEGISVNGDLYNIGGGSAIPDAPQAVVTEGEVSEYVFLNRARIAENEESTNTAIVEIEEALCELDTASTENATAVEDSLCELDEMISAISGGEN